MRGRQKKAGITTSENGQASTSTNGNKRLTKMETDCAIIIRGAPTTTDGYGIGQGQGQSSVAKLHSKTHNSANNHRKNMNEVPFYC